MAAKWYTNFVEETILYTKGYLDIPFINIKISVS